MNGYLAEVRKTYWAWRYAKARNDAREYVEKYACYAVRIAIERFEKQSGGSFCDLPLLFGQKFGQALAAILSREVYPLATDQILQTLELVEAMLERAAFGAFEEAIERTPAGFKHIDPSLPNEILPTPLKPIGRHPANEIEQIHPTRSAAADDEARKFVDRHRAKALCIAIELFREQPEGSLYDRSPLFDQKLEEALEERLSREVYPHVTHAIAQTRELLTFLLERAAVDAFDQAREAFKRVQPCLAGHPMPVPLKRN